MLQPEHSKQTQNTTNLQSNTLLQKVYYNENTQCFLVDNEKNNYPEEYALLFTTKDKNRFKKFYTTLGSNFYASDTITKKHISLVHIKNLYQIFKENAEASVDFKIAG